MLNRTLLLESLLELSNRELQEKYWIHGLEINQISSFTEAVSNLFSDANLTRASESGYLERYFTQEIVVTVKKLKNLIKLVPENLPPEEIINHPKMELIRLLAGKLLIAFRNEFKLSPVQAFLAMRIFLEKQEKVNNISRLLNLMPDQEDTDSEFWQLWMESVKLIQDDNLE